ncbi:MAG: DoxX family membrane protein [Polyangiales bacterium]
METLRRAQDWIDEHRDVWLDCVRIYLGVALMAKGFAFAAHSSSLYELAQHTSNVWLPGLAFHYVVPVHIVGGLLLTLGLVTRAAALANVPILIGAIVWVHRFEGFFTGAGSLELDLLVLFLLLLLFVAGAGPLSVDRYLARHSTDVWRPSRSY